MKEIRIIEEFVSVGSSFDKGDIVEVANSVAKDWIEGGLAEYIVLDEDTLIKLLKKFNLGVYVYSDEASVSALQSVVKNQVPMYEGKGSGSLDEKIAEEKGLDEGPEIDKEQTEEEG